MLRAVPPDGQAAPLKLQAQTERRGLALRLRARGLATSDSQRRLVQALCWHPRTACLHETLRRGPNNFAEAGPCLNLSPDLQGRNTLLLQARAGSTAMGEPSDTRPLHSTSSMIGSVTPPSALSTSRRTMQEAGLVLRFLAIGTVIIKKSKTQT